jgi:pimeloyl-ACP methyl ester carboxylesterase
MALARVGHTEFEYRSNGDGEPVVFVHGVLVASAFEPVVKQPSLAGYRKITYARLGYGKSGPLPAPASIERQAADLSDFVDALGLESAHVVAHSYGGAIALQLALESPRMVRSLCLLEPALILGASGAAYEESLRASSRRADAAGAAVAVHEFLELRSPGYRARMDAFDPAAFAEAVRAADTTFRAELPALPAWNFTELEARRINRPTLAILGEHSRQLSPRFEEAFSWLLATVPGARGAVIPDATHMMTFDNPAAVAAVIADFLDEVGNKQGTRSAPVHTDG